MSSKSTAPIALSVIAIIIAAAAVGLAVTASGKPGPAGPTGLQGPKGDTGSTGPAGPAGSAASIDLQNAVIKQSHGNMTLGQLAEIQPGLGTVMLEYGTRFWNIYYSAKAGKWDLANYNLKEMIEIQEVGETTRPARAAMLKAFETSYLDQLNATITKKDFASFNTTYNNTISGCNGCHAANGFAYIQYQLPSSPPPLP